MMTSWISNPFNELYVTEKIPSGHFVSLFSPCLVESASGLFMPGNVVLKGVQGSGKSMLLTLLKPETRLAYEQSTVDYPVPEKYQKFICGGINLTTSGAKNFSNILDLSDDEAAGIGKPSLLLGDYINYWIVDDLLRSLSLLVEKGTDELRERIGIAAFPGLKDEFAQNISRNDCWFDYLKGVSNYQELTSRLGDRIRTYKSFLTLNLLELPQDFTESKTSIGDPVSEVVSSLKQCGAIEMDVMTAILIDQYEELYHIEENKRSDAPVFRKLINNALYKRDQNISYRIGTRPYAWERNLSVYGTSKLLEAERDYREIRIDDLLKRNENRTGWIFPAFAEEVFRKRIEFDGYELDRQINDTIKYVFGSSITSREKAKIYAGANPEKIIKEDKNVPKQWLSFLKKIAKNDPLSAKFGEAWAQQKGKTDIINNIPEITALPWENEKKPWWRKERAEQALMQIAGTRNQAMKWFGKEDILGLSGGNILVFVSICQRIWNAWTRTLIGNEYEYKELPNSIAPDLQAVGIKEASNYWFKKITELSNGHSRQRFLIELGTKLNFWLFNDKSMSYPGNNGFSLLEEEIEADLEVKQFLDDAADFAELVKLHHTTKSADRKPRQKWYLKPILCPYFKIPYIRTKEPKYVKIDDVRHWLYKAKVLKEKKSEVGIGTTSKKDTVESTESPQLKLF